MANLFLFGFLLFAFFYDNVIAIRCISTWKTIFIEVLPHLVTFYALTKADKYREEVLLEITEIRNNWIKSVQRMTWYMLLFGDGS